LNLPNPVQAMPWQVAEKLQNPSPADMPAKAGKQTAPTNSQFTAIPWPAGTGRQHRCSEKPDSLYAFAHATRIANRIKAHNGRQSTPNGRLSQIAASLNLPPIVGIAAAYVATNM
tara:strand:+ start:158 stop:502 length:345 start_codon:yes stop_codon:yes gene_type:complete